MKRSFNNFILSIFKIELNIDYWAIFIPQFLQGFGFGLIFVPLSTTSLISIDKNQMTSATGIYNVMRTIAGSIGTAIASTGISTAGMNYFRSLIIHNVNVFNNATTNSLDFFNNALYFQGTSMALAKTQSHKLLEQIINNQAYMLACNRVFAAIALLFILSIPLLFLFRKNKIE